ncbi:MAG: hypothetical protein WBG85_12520 [Rhodanobacter sp.]
MDSSTKIAGAISAAAVLLFVGFVGYREFDRQRDRAEAVEVMQGIGDYAQQALAEGQAAEARRVQAQRRKAADDLRRRELGPEHRCVGGVVVTVRGSNYGQLGTVGDPVRCSGRYADRPIR